ncbi:MAG: 3-deoxy-7-phosphoheptulonate synthase [Acidobacteria bacterium]|nr:3-deoxy-7-phosphoheptulonate synthase [Acidobacteriota bacterium]
MALNSHSFRLAGRGSKPGDTVIDVGGVRIGGAMVVLMAGPCAVENEKQIIAAARGVRDAGAHILRGGAFKPRTSPYTFRGLGKEGLKLLALARKETGLPVVTEVMTPHDVGIVAEHSDILQVGSRNMQNFHLLEEVGRSRKPVLLKRGFAATIEEWLFAAEYILAQDNPNVMICERGIRTFETQTRNTLDLTAVALVRQLTHLPVIADPSHASGRRDLVPALALASIAAGAQGLLIEVHPDPDSALSDGHQSLSCEGFAAAVGQIERLAACLGRPLHPRLAETQTSWTR